MTDKTIDFSTLEDPGEYVGTPVEILASRGGFRDEHWRKVRRRIDANDTTPLPDEPRRSVVEIVGAWYEARLWPAIVLGGAALVVIGGIFAAWVTI